MRNTIFQPGLFKSWAIAAVMACGLAACGGGGGGGGPVAEAPAPVNPPVTTPPVTPPPAETPVTPVTPVPPPVPVPPPLESRYYASWTAAMQDATVEWPGTAVKAAPAFNNQTLRQVVRLSLGGDTVRVKLSNRFGKTPATFSGVRVARSINGNSEIDITTDRAVTFAGQVSVTIAAGAEVTSDAVTLPVTALSSLAVTSYFAGDTTIATIHTDARQPAYVVAGNQLSAASLQTAGAELRDVYYGLTAVEAASTEPAKLIVAFGDSLTDGAGTDTGSNKRYLNQLDDRLKAAGQARTGVVNGGISGNRWVYDFAGPSGSSRLERDVLEVRGVTHAILLLGINDIGFSEAFPQMQAASAQQVIDAIQAATNAAKARGVTVLLGTLTPFKGSGYYSATSEAKRLAINAWIRSQTLAAVIDFDQVVRSASDPAALNPLYDSGDHLHLNSAGYSAMAAAVDLSRL
ncbi:MAG: SGNH/GDSL hydrolase family protein [Pseudomonadota bacterium]